MRPRPPAGQQLAGQRRTTANGSCSILDCKNKPTTDDGDGRDGGAANRPPRPSTSAWIRYPSSAGTGDGCWIAGRRTDAVDDDPSTAGLVDELGDVVAAAVAVVAAAVEVVGGAIPFYLTKKCWTEQFRSSPFLVERLSS